MPPRKGMTADYQNIGWGGLSFATDLNFVNLPLTYEQRLWALNGLYAFALARNEEKEEYKEDKKVGLLIGGIKTMLLQAGEDYKARFESHSSMDDAENKYRELLNQIFEKITELQGKTKLIEKERVVQEEIG